MASKLFYTNLIASASSLTPSAENANYDADNLQTNNYAEPWRTTNVSSYHYVTANLGSAQSASACFLGNINLTSSATYVRIQGHTSDLWTSPDIDEYFTLTRLNGYHRCLYHDFASASKQYWRIFMSEVGLAAGFYEVGVWYLGVPIELGDNWDSSNTRRLVHSNVTHRTEYNQKYVYGRDWHWEFDLTFTNIQSSTIDQLKSLKFNQQGNYTPFALVLDDTDPSEAYWVRMEGDLTINKIHYDRYSVRATFIEEEPGVISPR